MAKIINKFRKSSTTVSGSADVNFSFQLGVIVRQIMVDFISSGTDFDFDIIDSNDEVIYSRDDETGSFNELISLPLSGAYTARIRNASADEAVVVRINAHEI